MAERRLVAGLDLGSTKTCAVIAEVVGDLPRAPLAKVLGVGLAKNGGVRRGMVRDIDETTRSVAAALKDAERMAGVKVNDVTCGIAGEHVSARGSQGVVAVSRDEITAQDVARVNEVARAVSLGRDHELLHDIPQEYIVDQQRGISDPVGMTGTRLEVEMYLVTVQSTAAQNLRKSVQRAGYRVRRRQRFQHEVGHAEKSWASRWSKWAAARRAWRSFTTGRSDTWRRSSTPART